MVSDLMVSVHEFTDKTSLSDRRTRNTLFRVCLWTNYMLLIMGALTSSCCLSLSLSMGLSVDLVLWTWNSLWRGGPSPHRRLW